MSIVIYDNNGTIYFSGSAPVPESLQYMEFDPPQGKYLKGIDTTVVPHQPMFENYPKSEMDILKDINEQQQADIDYIMLLLD